MGQLLQAAAAMQNQLVAAQQELAEMEIEGTAGGGLVTVTVSGQGELVDLSIAAGAIDATDPAETAQTLADLVLAAYRDARRAAEQLQEQKMGPLAEGLSGGGLPGFGGMPGLAGDYEGTEDDDFEDEDSGEDEPGGPRAGGA
jgi:DNA-binding YbaB/EbfC family protein